MIFYKFSLIQPKTDRIRPRTFAHKGGYNIRVHRRVATTYSCTEGLLQHRRALITTKNIAVFNGGILFNKKAAQMRACLNKNNRATRFRAVHTQANDQCKRDFNIK